MDLIELCDIKDSSEFFHGLENFDSTEECIDFINTFQKQRQELYLKYLEAVRKRIPKRNQFLLEEEYQEKLKDFQIGLLEDINTEKEVLFKRVLNSYNNLINHKVNANIAHYNENKELEETKQLFIPRIRIMLGLFLGMGFAIPNGIIKYILMGGDAIWFLLHYLVLYWDNAKAYYYEIALELINEMNNPYQEISLFCREDYQNFQKEYTKYKKSILEGENQTKELLSLIVPNFLQEEEKKEYVIK